MRLISAVSGVRIPAPPHKSPNLPLRGGNRRVIMKKIITLATAGIFLLSLQGARAQKEVEAPAVPPMLPGQSPWPPPKPRNRQRPKRDRQRSPNPRARPIPPLNLRKGQPPNEPPIKRLPLTRAAPQPGPTRPPKPRAPRPPPRQTSRRPNPRRPRHENPPRPRHPPARIPDPRRLNRETKISR